MVDVKKLYESDNGRLWCDYQPMVDAFGKVVIQVDDDDYQGDTRVLYHNDDGRIGHLIFGWGSCSYCDALMRCGTIEDVQELCNELEADIEWFDNKAEALEWFKTHDWYGDFCWCYKETREYVEKAIEYLSK